MSNVELLHHINRLQSRVSALELALAAWVPEPPEEEGIEEEEPMPTEWNALHRFYGVDESDFR